MNCQRAFALIEENCLARVARIGRIEVHTRRREEGAHHGLHSLNAIGRGYVADPVPILTAAAADAATAATASSAATANRATRNIHPRNDRRAAPSVTAAATTAAAATT